MEVNFAMKKIKKQMLALVSPDSTVWHLEKRTPRPKRLLIYLFCIALIGTGVFMFLNGLKPPIASLRYLYVAFFLFMGGVLGIAITIASLRQRNLHDYTLFVSEGGELYRVMPNLAATGFNRFMMFGGLVGLAIDAMVENNFAKPDPATPYGIASMQRTGKVIVYKIAGVADIKAREKDYKIKGLVLVKPSKNKPPCEAPQTFIVDKDFTDVDSLLDQLRKTQANGAAAQ